MAAYIVPPSLTGRLIPWLAVLAGIGIAAGLATAPAETLDAVVARSGVSALLPQAAPPVGVTGRSLIALAVGALVAALGFAGRIGWPPRVGPARRRADSHPDAPPCRPLRAHDELGAPLAIEEAEAVALPIAPEPPVPPAIQPVPADLDQPLSAFDPDAIPSQPKEPVRAVAPLTRVAKVVALPMAEAEMAAEPAAPAPARITAFSLAPVACAPDAEPRILAPVVPTPESIGALVARLEKVARDAARDRRARAERQPSLDDTLARLRQMATG